MIRPYFRPSAIIARTSSSPLSITMRTPGHDFDPINGHRTMRFSFAGAHDQMLEATDRIAAWLK